MVSFLTIFRIIAFFEGLSYIFLLFFATPYKYINEDPQYVKMLGMPHGILFILYLVLAYILRSEKEWFANNYKFIFLLGIIPFGTFYLDKKIKRLDYE